MNTPPNKSGMSSLVNVHVLPIHSMNSALFSQARLMAATARPISPARYQRTWWMRVTQVSMSSIEAISDFGSRTTSPAPCPRTAPFSRRSYALR